MGGTRERSWWQLAELQTAREASRRVHGTPRTSTGEVMREEPEKRNRRRPFGLGVRPRGLEEPEAFPALDPSLGPL